jgi:hypothetical protein
VCRRFESSILLECLFYSLLSCATVPEDSVAMMLQTVGRMNMICVWNTFVPEEKRLKTTGQSLATVEWDTFWRFVLRPTVANVSSKVRLPLVRLLLQLNHPMGYQYKRLQHLRQHQRQQPLGGNQLRYLNCTVPLHIGYRTAYRLGLNLTAYLV